MLQGIVSAGAPGQDRLGRKGDGMQPALVNIDYNHIVSCGVGWRHNVVVYENGRAYGWGCNDEKQLGNLPSEVPVPMFMSSFKDFHVTWVHCGDRITVILTDTGEAYAIGSMYGENPVRLQSSQPFVFCTCSLGAVYALDCNGDIFSCTTQTGKGVVSHLPEPVCDIAVGSTFCLAVTVSGIAYAKGNDAACGCGSSSPSDAFQPISSLIGIKISRVVAYGSHSIAIARDGRVFVCGTTSDGRIGVPDASSPISSFQQLKTFNGEKIIDADCGDAHSIFLTKDGHAYACGVSTDGRTLCGRQDSFLEPVKADLSGVTYIRCGCFHSIAFVNMPAPVHPGLLFFGLLVGSVRSPHCVKLSREITADVSPRSVSMYGFLIGDTVTIDDQSTGIVLGVVGDKICCSVDGELKTFKKRIIKFQKRSTDPLKTVKTSSGMEILIDTKEELCLSFGLLPGDVVSHPVLGRGVVEGFSRGTIWFTFDSHQGCVRAKSLGLAGIFSSLKLIESRRKFVNVECSDGITYPAEITRTYTVLTPDSSVGTVIGTIGIYLCVEDCETKKKSLFLKSKCVETLRNESFEQNDVVLTEKGISFIVNVFKGKVQVHPLTNILKNLPSILIENDKVSLIARVIGQGEMTVDGHKIDISVESSRKLNSIAIPGDIFATEDDGFVTILGVENNKIVFRNQKGDIREFKNGSLVSRNVSKCKRVFTIPRTGAIELSIYTRDFRGLIFVPGDEFTFDSKNFVALGTRDGYLWANEVGTGVMKCFQPQVLQKAELFAKPTKNIDIFFH
ncbi:hypothetical protein TVAG_199020 [Trichomonas vaginalis G3]|uniref:Regulator of chromosome condensation family protein n=1 Tax=Trichomonas vaginalis (strain ATCC PRA-98 / G3) TaxID=412133 RepID=A2DDT7_TRIV3|nr:ubiquitin-protein transferase protein [Trichomonas vaginalis G3]EAY21463.1 hypothetical protein TVAG_199020 [Trichomonas vaginalis G3]KAI5490676.1 ubiquitin-protein transferase protein [Trichomonas vaginalis G3]|eukprot:XP_001582449.1 hypothetical protein [Trichomonas vaginalis G3]